MHVDRLLGGLAVVVLMKTDPLPLGQVQPHHHLVRLVAPPVIGHQDPGLGDVVGGADVQDNVQMGQELLEELVTLSKDSECCSSIALCLLKIDYDGSQTFS